MEKEQMPLVSIVVPVYHVGAYIRQCVDSILGQTYQNIQLILVDDGGDDECPDICNQYALQDARVRVIHQENKGLSGARNSGMEAVTGSYVMFVDSDDWIDLETIDTALRFSEENDLDVVLWSYASEYHDKTILRPLFGEEPVIWEDGRTIHRRIVGLIGSELSEPHKADACVTAWGKLYRRGVVENVRFVDTKRIGTEDALFNIYALKNGHRVGYLPETFSHYRKTNETSLTSGFKAELAYRWETLYQMIEDYLNDISAEPEFYSALNNRVCLSMIGIGLNELSNPAGFFTKSKNLRNVLRLPRWETAYRDLCMKYFPLKWKAFFYLCKHKQTELLLLMLYAINGLRSILAS